MHLVDIATSDLLHWYLYFDSQLDKLADLQSDVPESNQAEILEIQSSIDDLALKMVLVAGELDKRSRSIDFGIDYNMLGDIEIEEF